MVLRIYSAYFDLGDNWVGTSADALLEMANRYATKYNAGLATDHGQEPVDVTTATPDAVKDNIDFEHGETGCILFTIT